MCRTVQITFCLERTVVVEVCAITVVDPRFASWKWKMEQWRQRKCLPFLSAKYHSSLDVTVHPASDRQMLAGCVE